MTIALVARALAAWTPGLPALGALIVGAALLGRTPPSERFTARVAQAALWLGAIGSLAAAGLFLAGGGEPFEAPLGRWFHSGDYGFELSLRIDALSAASTLLVAVLLLATARFSIAYLHREPGFHRFFLLVLLFGAGMQTLVLAGSYDLLFAGWEIVGLTSVLLVGFFHERTAPVRASTRVLVTYRLTDVGFLFAIVLLHHAAHTTHFGALFDASRSELPVTAAALGLLLAAMGKSAQAPLGGWLPRAMEGPTASSAVFYGGLSVHAGVFLVIRSWPLFEASLPARVALVVVGASTAITSALSAQVSADAKSALAYATISQVALMFVECGLGFPNVAIAHLLVHSLLRYYQFLRTPSVLQDLIERRAALGAAAPDALAGKWEKLAPRTRRLLHRLAVERFELEAALDRWVLRPLLALATALDALERKVERASAAPKHPPEAPRVPHEAHE